MSFLQKHFCLNICYGNILLCFGLEWLKSHQFLLPTFDKYAIKNNPIIQLCSIFPEKVHVNKLTVWTFQSHRLNSFSAIKKTVTGMEGAGEGGEKVSSFYSIIIFVCSSKFTISIEFSWKSFYHNCQFLSFYCFNYFFSSESLLVLVHLMNMDKWLSFWAVLCFVFKFNLRERKQTLIVSNF